MPIYEYECMQCGKREEAWQKFSDPALTTCKHCAGTLQKLISHSAFHLKGSGWYATDYVRKSNSGSDSYKSETKSETPKADTSEKSSDTTS